jgi:hypothetical protein
VVAGEDESAKLHNELLETQVVKFIDFSAADNFDVDVSNQIAEFRLVG